jgi:hypothetical protein
LKKKTAKFTKKSNELIYAYSDLLSTGKKLTKLPLPTTLERSLEEK